MTDKPQEHSAEQAIIDGRRAKAARLRARGENPFANDLVPATKGAFTLDIGAVRGHVASAEAGGTFDEAKVKELAGGKTFHVRGRIMALRSAGGLTFIKLRDRTAEIQLLISQAQIGDGYAALEDFDIGDVIESEGALTASKRGELSLEPIRLRLLTKAYRPLPEKWHGLTDVETRYRQRYVDLIANPKVADVFRARSYIVRKLRSIMDDESFLEVETPTLHTILGGATAKPFTTHHNALDMNLFMRIAPELYLKRLVVGGLERVYEIGRAYRNEGISTRHNPEFTMFEFYQAYATCDDLMSFTEILLKGVDQALGLQMPGQWAEWSKARLFSFDEPFVRMPMAEAIARGVQKAEIKDFVSAASEGGGRAVVALLREDFGASMKEWSKSSARAKAIDWGNFRKAMMKCENDGERLFIAYEYLAEPFLPDDYRTKDGTRSLPVFVTEHPFEISPLARRNDKRPEIVDRFELFIHGRELCNAFSELNDPEDQAERFNAQAAKKAKGDDEAMEYDADYIRALEHGLPPTAGFGMGIDRLVMMLTNQASIRDVILFPLLRAER